MIATLLFGLFALLMIIGVPVAIALGLSGMLAIRGSTATAMLIFPA